jgi:hypothetical protein
MKKTAKKKPAKFKEKRKGTLDPIYKRLVKRGIIVDRRRKR